MSKHRALSVCWVVTLACLVVVSAAPASSLPTEASVLPVASATSAVQMAGSAGASIAAGPPIHVATPDIDWGDPAGGTVPYAWNVAVTNPNSRPVAVRVQLDFLSSNGNLVHQDSAMGQLQGNSSATFGESGSVTTAELDQIAEARGVPAAWWSDEAYKFRTLSAYVDGMRTLDVFFVLENWLGRPVTASGTVDLYIMERERLHDRRNQALMQRPFTTLFSRRFNVDKGDFRHRQIGFKTVKYAPPALSLGPIHYSMFDLEPHADEGLIWVVFRTVDGAEIIGEDRIYF